MTTHYEAHLTNHLRPFFGKMAVVDIDDDTAQDYRIHRSKTSVERTGKPPARNTLDNELITARMVMKAAKRKGWVKAVPDFSNPYKKQMKVVPRPWFTPESEP